MSEPASSETQTQAPHAPLQLVRLPVDKPQSAVAFLHARSQGVMDLIAHFWERLAQTPPLQRPDLHLVVAMPLNNTNFHINISNLDPAAFSGAMLYVPKAHRADVLSLDPSSSAALAAYIAHQGPKAIRSDNTSSNDVTTDAVDTSKSPPPILLTDFTAAARVSAIPADFTAARNGNSNGANGTGAPQAGGGATKVPIDFLTGQADGIAWMVPHLLPAVHRKSPARQLVNVVMQLPPAAGCQPDANVRIAKESDIPTLNRWRRQYKEERGILFDADLDAWVQTQRVFVYETPAPPSATQPVASNFVAVAKFDLELPQLIEIGGVYTFPEYRKQGYGAKIVADLACRIRTLGKIPTLQVDEQNTPALRLYESAGWQPRGKLARVWLTG